MTQSLLSQLSCMALCSNHILGEQLAKKTRPGESDVAVIPHAKLLQINERARAVAASPLISPFMLRQ